MKYVFRKIFKIYLFLGNGIVYFSESLWDLSFEYKFVKIYYVKLKNIDNRV